MADCIEFVFEQTHFGVTPTLGSEKTVETFTVDLRNQFGWKQNIRRKGSWQTSYQYKINLTNVTYGDLFTFIAYYETHVGNNITLLDELGESMVGVITSDITCTPINKVDEEATGCDGPQGLLFDVTFNFERTDI